MDILPQIDWDNAFIHPDLYLATYGTIPVPTDTENNPKAVLDKGKQKEIVTGESVGQGLQGEAEGAQTLVTLYGKLQSSGLCRGNSHIVW
jgi:hypothetical protein